MPHAHVGRALLDGSERGHAALAPRVVDAAEGAGGERAEALGEAFAPFGGGKYRFGFGEGKEGRGRSGRGLFGWDDGLCRG